MYKTPLPLNYTKSHRMRTNTQKQVFSQRDKATEKHVWACNLSQTNMSSNFNYITKITNLPACADEGVYVSQGEKVTATSLQNQNRQGSKVGSRGIKEREKKTLSRSKDSVWKSVNCNCAGSSDYLRGVWDLWSGAHERPVLWACCPEC